VNERGISDYNTWHKPATSCFTASLLVLILDSFFRAETKDEKIGDMKSLGIQKLYLVHG
jgi:hypothetical protein